MNTQTTSYGEVSPQSAHAARMGPGQALRAFRDDTQTALAANPSRIIGAKRVTQPGDRPLSYDREGTVCSASRKTAGAAFLHGADAFGEVLGGAQDGLLGVFVVGLGADRLG